MEFVKHFGFFVRDFVEDMIAKDIDMTTATEGHAAAGTEDGKVIGFTGFHNIEADVRRDLEVMNHVIPVEDFDVH
jgi:hypothetical protein